MQTQATRSVTQEIRPIRTGGGEIGQRGVRSALRENNAPQIGVLSNERFLRPAAPFTHTLHNTYTKHIDVAPPPTAKLV